MQTYSGYQHPYSAQSVLGFLNQNFAILLLGGIVFAGGFFSGSLWKENGILRTGGGKVLGAVPPAAAPAGDPSAPTVVGELPEITDEDHIRGNKNAKLTLVEYSDFECPFCAKHHPTMQQIMTDYGDKVRWVYRHYPLSFHPNAQKAAEASECVAELGGNDAFWKYSDAVIAENDKLGGSLSPAAINTAAQAAGVDQAQFKSCLDSGKMAAKVQEDMDGGTTAGVNATPGTIVLNKDGGKELVLGAVPLSQIKQTIDANL